MKRLEIEYIPVAEIVTYENNPKVHPAEQIEKIKESILKYGFNDPIALWRDNIIVEGHGRLIAAIELGMKEVPIIRLSELTESQRHEYALLHNQLTISTTLISEIVDSELADISTIEANEKTD